VTDLADPDADALEQDAADLPSDRYFDRELSWLAFNERVLELAEDEVVPLLERAKFLAIFASNLDEFYMVRVAGLKRRLATGIAVRAASGMLPREVHEAILAATRTLMARHAALFRAQVGPQLASHGIEVLRFEDLGEAERAAVAAVFDERVFPVLTPLASVSASGDPRETEAEQAQNEFGTALNHDDERLGKAIEDE